MDNERIVGICMTMCPEAEIKERERAGLIHFLERADDQPEKPHSVGRGGWSGHIPGDNRHKRFSIQIVKADINRAVKEYTRPAAGVNKSNPSDLRPPTVLKKTVAYLCTKILTRTDLPFIEIYDFVFDRLRAVRQDMVIQRICDKSAITILETIVKFHLYAEHRFRTCAPDSYDPCINQKHLKDCLKTLLSFYGLNNFNGPSRAFFEALYCLCSPESYEVISRAFVIKREMERYPVFSNSLELCLAIQNRNFYKYFQLLDELPPLLAAFAVQQISLIRLHALRAICVSYGIKTCKIPLEWIDELLCYPNQACAEKDLLKIGCQIIKSEENGIKFVKFEKTSPILNYNQEILIDLDVKFTILNGLNNIEVITLEHICPWSKELI